MGVTIYVFDTHQRARAAILDGVTELVHHEKGHTLEAAIPARFQAVPGEYLGFRCVDNRWRLFCITETETDDAKGVDYIDAIDAAVDDLKYINVQDARQEDVTAKQAVETLISGTEWALGEVTATDKAGTTDAEWESLWSALQTVETVLDVRVVPYYLIRDGTVVGKKIDVLSSERVFRGCFLEEKLLPANIKITRSNRPVTVMYGLGKAAGTGEDAERLTLADAEWSKANGDPADKPKGQLWVEDTEATAIYGRREERVLLNDVEDANTLMDETWKALQEYTKPKVNVEATFHDLDQLGKNEYKKVSIGDEAQVRTKRQELISTQIYDIDRDYVKPEQSKIKSGTETGTATSKIAGLIRSTLHTQETLTIYKNRFLEDEALIQLNANTILANAELIRTHAQQITTLVGEVSEQGQLISGVQIDISGLNQRYTVVAGQVSAQGELISGVMLDLDGQAGRIAALADEILLKANKIDLLGYVTATQLETNYAKIADLDSVTAQVTNLMGGLVTASVLESSLFRGAEASITFLRADAFNLGNELVQKKTISMGDVSSTGKALGIGDLKLDHSHEVTVSSDGKLKMGKATGEGSTFDLAATQYYKNGVAAATTKGAESLVFYAGGKEGVADLNYGSSLSITATTTRADGTALSKGILVKAPPDNYNTGWNDCIRNANAFAVLINYYSAGETLYDAAGNVAAGPWYKGTPATRYSLPASKP